MITRIRCFCCRCRFCGENKIYRYHHYQYHKAIIKMNNMNMSIIMSIASVLIIVVSIIMINHCMVEASTKSTRPINLSPLISMERTSSSLGHTKINRNNKQIMKRKELFFINKKSMLYNNRHHHHHYWNPNRYIIKTIQPSLRSLSSIVFTNHYKCYNNNRLHHMYHYHDELLDPKINVQRSRSSYTKSSLLRRFCDNIWILHANKRDNNHQDNDDDTTTTIDTIAKNDDITTKSDTNDKRRDMEQNNDDNNNNDEYNNNDDNWIVGNVLNDFNQLEQAIIISNSSFDSIYYERNQTLYDYSKYYRRSILSDINKYIIRPILISFSIYMLYTTIQLTPNTNIPSTLFSSLSTSSPLLIMIRTWASNIYQMSCMVSFYHFWFAAMSLPTIFYYLNANKSNTHQKQHQKQQDPLQLSENWKNQKRNERRRSSLQLSMSSSSLVTTTSKLSSCNDHAVQCVLEQWISVILGYGIITIGIVTFNVILLWKHKILSMIRTSLLLLSSVTSLTSVGSISNIYYEMMTTTTTKLPSNLQLFSPSWYTWYRIPCIIFTQFLLRTCIQIAIRQYPSLLYQCTRTNQSRPISFPIHMIQSLISIQYPILFLGIDFTNFMIQQQLRHGGTIPFTLYMIACLILGSAKVIFQYIPPNFIQHRILRQKQQQQKTTNYRIIKKNNMMNRLLLSMVPLSFLLLFGVTTVIPHSNNISLLWNNGFIKSTHSFLINAQSLPWHSFLKHYSAILYYYLFRTKHLIRILLLGMILIGPIIHIISFLPIFRVSYIHGLSLGTNPTEFIQKHNQLVEFDSQKYSNNTTLLSRNFSIRRWKELFMKNTASSNDRNCSDIIYDRSIEYQWRYWLIWREPQRIYDTIQRKYDQFWYWLFLSGSVDDQLQRELPNLKRELYECKLSIWQRIENEIKQQQQYQNMNEILMNDTTNVTTMKKKNHIIIHDSTQWKNIAMNNLAKKHQQDYESNTISVRKNSVWN